MTDNSSLPVASGNETFANNDIGGVKYPRQKSTWGPAGTANDTDIASGKAMPIQIRSATGLVPIGEPTDAAATQTDTTSVTAISIWKQISKSVQLMVFGAGTAAAAQRTTLASDDPAVATLGAVADASVTAGATGSISAKLRRISNDIGSLVTAIGSTAWDLGAGAIGSRTQRIAIASDSAGVIATAAPGTLSAAGPSVTAVNPSNYETVAASQTAQALGATGATGDFINGLLVIPATTSPGNVLLLDNATSITVFTGGATSVSNLVPFFIPLGMTSVSGAWKVTTGASVSVIGVGKFT